METLRRFSSKLSGKGDGPPASAPSPGSPAGVDASSLPAAGGAEQAGPAGAGLPTTESWVFLEGACSLLSSTGSGAVVTAR